MYLVLKFEDGSEQVKEFDSSSTLTLDGTARNANGEQVAAPSTATWSCEGLVAVELAADLPAVEEPAVEEATVEGGSDQSVETRPWRWGL